MLAKHFIRANEIEAPELMYKVQGFLNYRLFENKLINLGIYMIPYPHTPNGVAYYHGTWTDERKYELVSNRYQGGTMWDFSNLCHEMVHQWIDPIRGHGEDFVRVARIVGLECTPWGDKIIPNGGFDRWIRYFMRTH